MLSPVCHYQIELDIESTKSKNSPLHFSSIQHPIIISIIGVINSAPVTNKLPPVAVGVNKYANILYAANNPRKTPIKFAKVPLIFIPLCNIPYTIFIIIIVQPIAENIAIMAIILPPTLIFK